MNLLLYLQWYSLFIVCRVAVHPIYSLLKVPVITLNPFNFTETTCPHRELQARSSTKSPYQQVETVLQKTRYRGRLRATWRQSGYLNNEHRWVDTHGCHCRTHYLQRNSWDVAYWLYSRRNTWSAEWNLARGSRTGSSTYPTNNIYAWNKATMRWNHIYNTKSTLNFVVSTRKEVV